MKNKSQQKKQPPARTPFTAWMRHEWVHYLLLVAGAFLLYGRTISFQYNLDDDYILYQLARSENSISGLFSLFKQWYASADYRPVTMATFWLERLIFGQVSPATAHSVNVILFSLVLIFIYRLVNTGKFIAEPGSLKMLALVTALIFLVHPNHVSVVANIKSRDNLLSMLFGTLTAIQFLLLYDHKQYWRSVLCVLFMVMAFLSKADAYSFAVLPVLIILFFRKINFKNSWKYIFAAGLFFVIGILVKNSLTQQLDQKMRVFVPQFSENPLFGNVTTSEKISMAATSLMYYIKFLIVPFGYYFYYGYNEIPLTPLFSAWNIACLLIVLFFSATAIYFYRFKQKKILLFCLLWFGIAIGYALNLYIPVSGIVMDRYNFIPSTAFCLALAWLILDFTQTPRLIRWRSLVLAGVLLIFASFTIYRTSDWKNSFVLFDKDLPHLQHSVHANRIAAGTYIHLALEEEMKPHYNKMLTDSFINKGERYALQALKIYDKDARVWEHLGLCALYREDNNSALTLFRKSFETDTTYLSGVNYLGAAFWNLNQLDSAIYYFNYVIQKEPAFGYSANNLVNLYMSNGRKREADSLLNVLSRRYPQDAALQNKIREVSSR